MSHEEVGKEVGSSEEGEEDAGRGESSGMKGGLTPLNGTRS